MPECTTAVTLTLSATSTLQSVRAVTSLWSANPGPKLATHVNAARGKTQGAVALAIASKPKDWRGLADHASVGVAKLIDACWGGLASHVRVGVAKLIDTCWSRLADHVQHEAKPRVF